MTGIVYQRRSWYERWGPMMQAQPPSEAFFELLRAAQQAVSSLLQALSIFEALLHAADTEASA